MRRKAFTFWEMVVVLAIVLILAAVLFPVVGHRHGSPSGAKRSSCQSNLKQISLGILQYQQDYNTKYPLVNSGKAGWVDILQPYIKSFQLFQCPSETSESVNGKTDYFYNARLAGQPDKKLEFAANTIMSGDGTGESPSNASLSQFPSNWTTDSDAPAWRHIDGANYGFADGHVKWFKPAKVTNQKPDSEVYTFAPW